MATRETALLNSKVRDVITGFQGVIIARTEWLNGCFRVHVQPTELKDGKPIEALSFDVQQVEVLEASVQQQASAEKVGGPFDAPKQDADPTAH